MHGERKIRSHGAPLQRMKSGMDHQPGICTWKKDERICYFLVDVPNLFQALASVKLEHLVLETSISLLRSAASFSVILLHNFAHLLGSVTRSQELCTYHEAIVCAHASPAEFCKHPRFDTLSTSTWKTP
jgi:hypothetical protein